VAPPEIALELAALAELSATSAQRIVAPYVATDPPRKLISGSKLLLNVATAAVALAFGMPGLQGCLHAASPTQDQASIPATVDPAPADLKMRHRHQSS
jgi:hypothetical protein